MKYVILWLLSLCLTFSPFSGFSIGIMNVMSNVNNAKPEPVIEQEPVDKPAEIPVEEPQGRNITLNNTLDLDGYCTIMIPSEYFTLRDDSTFVKKSIRYNDKKSKAIMSYVTNISEDADIPGYIVREAAGLDIVTNSKHEVEYKSGTWMVVPANKEIDNCYPTVYYITSEDETTAFWIRVDRHKDTDEEEFEEVITAIIDSYNLYYIGGTVFDTPTGGYYAENDVVGQEVVGDTTDYKKNEQGNEVWDSGDTGFDRRAEIASKWDSMEIIIDDNKIKLPCTLKDIEEAGFTPNDNNIKTDTYHIEPDLARDVMCSNEKGTNITLSFYNDSKTELRDISECTVIKIDIDTSEFVAVAPSEEDTSEENTENEDGSETDPESESDESTESDEEDSSEEDSTDPESVMNGDREFDNITHSIILPRGILLNVYTQDILDSYGEPNDKYRSESRLVYTWKKDGKYFTLECGAVKNIKHITMSTMENK